MAAAREVEAEDVEELVPDELLPEMRPAVPAPRRKKGSSAAGRRAAGQGGVARGPQGGDDAAGRKGRQKRCSTSRAAEGDGEAEVVGGVGAPRPLAADDEKEEEAVAFGRKGRRGPELERREARAAPAAETRSRRAKPPTQDLLMLQEPDLASEPAAAPRHIIRKSPCAMINLPRGACSMD